MTTLAEALSAAAAAEDPAVDVTIGPHAATEYRVGERTFAILDPTGTSVELHLDGPIAAAARRTPDTDASPRGPDWVRFRPVELDGPALDRLTAWFAAAARRAA